MAINYATQFAPKVAETFARESLTDSACGGEFQFTGNKAVKVLTVGTVPLTDYNREGANRYGEPVELGDVVQEMVMEDDKAFSMTIDKGNDLDQMNLKGAAEAMKREMAQVVVPYIDKYRLTKWSRGAGIVKGYAAADMPAGLMEAIFDAGAAMDNAGVPLTDRTLFIPNQYYKHLLLSNTLLGVEKLGEKALAKGVVGELCGMTVKRVPDDYLPNGAYFLVKWKSASADPVKLQEGKIHKDPPGLSGNLLEGRIYQDAFVLQSCCQGVYAAVAADAFCDMPTFNLNRTTLRMAIDGPSGATIVYTKDGSDPRYSRTAQVYASPVPSQPGDVYRAACYKPGYGFFSAVRDRHPVEEAS